MAPRLLGKKALVYRLIFGVMSKCRVLRFWWFHLRAESCSKIANHLVPQPQFQIWCTWIILKWSMILRLSGYVSLLMLFDIWVANISNGVHSRRLSCWSVSSMGEGQSLAIIHSSACLRGLRLVTRLGKFKASIPFNFSPKLVCLEIHPTYINPRAYSIQEVLTSWFIPQHFLSTHWIIYAAMDTDS